MRRLLFAAVTLLGVAGLNAQADAAPTLAMRVYQDGVAQAGLTASSDNGILNVAGSTAYFDFLSAFASGSPANLAPAMAGQLNLVSTANFTGTHTIRVELTQTDLPSSSAGGVMAQLGNTLTANLLASMGRVSEVVVSNYASIDNLAFDISDVLLASATFTQPADARSTIVANLSLPNALFSETMVVEATFTGGNATLSASAQIVAVPEPASIALFSTGLLGLGLLARIRRRQS